MANNSQSDLIVTTIAAVLQPIDPPRGIDLNGNVLATILKRPLTVAEGPRGQISVTSNRDQVEVQLFPNKIDVRESSGDVAQARNKIPGIIHGFLATILAAETIRTYGINFILEVTVESPREWLGNNLLDHALASKLGTSPSSNLVALVFDRPPKTWTVRFEAQPDAKLNVNFNASEHRGVLPSLEQLEEEVGEQYDRLKAFLAAVGVQI